MDDQMIVLPPGFQFDPTDEELVMYYLKSKVANLPFYPNIIPDLDFSSSDPWELKERALFSKNQWYFFSQVKETRATERGYWKELHTNESIFKKCGEKVAGIKKYCVYYIHEVQTNWIMEEFHLSSRNSFKKPSKKRESEKVLGWVLCRVHESNDDSQGMMKCQLQTNCDHEVELSALDEIFLSMDDNEQEEVTFPY